MTRFQRSGNGVPRSRHIIAIVERCSRFHTLKTERVALPDVCIALAASGRNTRSIMMRIILSAFAIATAVALAAPAFADPSEANPNYGGAYAVAPAVGGAAVGTAVGGVAGLGTVALIDAVVEPCRGFHALVGMNEHECVNGVYVGDQPRMAEYQHGRRHIVR